MEVSWKSLVEDLERFPGSALQLQESSPWQQVGSAYIVVSLGLGEVYDSKRLKLMLATDIKGINITVLEATEQDDSTVPDGVQDAIAFVSRAIIGSGGPLYVRLALVRLCHELYMELSPQESRALLALGKGEVQQPLARGVSRGTSGACTSGGFSFEDDVASASEDDAEEKPRQAEAPTRHLELSEEGPPREETVLWKCAMERLQKVPGESLKLEGCSSWDRREGLVELLLRGTGKKHEWQQLRVVLIVSERRATSVVLKGAQVVPRDVASAVAEMNSSEDVGSGPESLRAAILALAAAVDLELADEEKAYIEALFDSADAETPKPLTCSRALEMELRAVEALTFQSGLIEQQIKHLEQCPAAPGCLKEVARLQRSLAEVAAEREAASAAVQGAMLEITAGDFSEVRVRVHIEDAPAQSLRGHGVQAASEMICRALQKTGPWGHYAAHQFSAMISREQQLHGEFVCFYHSYSIAALIYEVQAEVARRILGLPADLAPVPRLAGAAASDCTDLASLRSAASATKKDHMPEFRALGLSCSCSVFANSSEAPPLSCFGGGYSCTDVQFKQLLTDFLTRCCGGNKEQGEALAVATIRIARDYDVDGRNVGSRNHRFLTGFMLQIFVHRSIVEDYVYASEPYGKPINMPILHYLEGQQSADGQARILFQPSVFLDPAKARLYHYCARPLLSCMDSSLPSSRGSFVKALMSALEPMFADHPAESIRERLGLA